MEILLPYKLYWKPPQPSIHPRLQIPILHKDSKITQHISSFEYNIKSRFDTANKIKIKFTYIQFIIELNSGA